MCTNLIGKGDAMNAQQQIRYKEATRGLEIPITPDAPQMPRGEINSPPSNATVKLPDGRMITQDSYDKLQLKLKSRG